MANEEPKPEGITIKELVMDIETRRGSRLISYMAFPEALLHPDDAFDNIRDNPAFIALVGG